MSEVHTCEINRRLNRLDNAVTVLSKSANSSRLLTRLVRGSTAFLGFVVAILGLWSAIQPGNQVLGSVSAGVGLIITYLNTQFNPTSSRARVVKVNTLIDDIEQFIEQIRFRIKVVQGMKDKSDNEKQDDYVKLLEEVIQAEDKFRDRIREITIRAL